ncbi:MAG: hypothetical protein ABFS42_13270 [Candidatus Krumholzibacteriota bacterium]
MKTNKTTIRTRIMTKVRTNRKRLSLVSLPVLALLLTIGAVDEAQARIRVKATVRTPYGRVQVDNGPYHHTRVYRQELPVRYYRDHYRVTKRDRKIARRLGSFTGVPKRELLQLRKQGYTWGEIGRWLDVPRKVVRAAKSGKRWKRFMNRHHRNHYCEVGGRW